MLAPSSAAGDFAARGLLTNRFSVIDGGPKMGDSPVTAMAHPQCLHAPHHRAPTVNDNPRMRYGRPEFGVVGVGGGAMGCAVAAFLLGDPGFGGHVAIVERDPTYRHASSSLSASSIRQQFSTPENIRMSRFGIEFLRDLARGPDPVDVGLEERGYLFLPPPGGAAAARG